MSKPTTAWAHLPNAKHIDAVLAHVKAHPDKWDAARPAGWDAAREAAREAARDVAREAAWEAARGVARATAWGALRCLVAWDDAADVLHMPPDAVTLLAQCGDSRAILLYPAVVAMAGEQHEI